MLTVSTIHRLLNRHCSLVPHVARSTNEIVFNLAVLIGNLEYKSEQVWVYSNKPFKKHRPLAVMLGKKHV